MMILGLSALTLRGEVSKEYQIKAAFLYNFTKFVEWPPASFANETSPIVIGVVGRNPFDRELEKILQGRTVQGRPIVVKPVATPGDLAATHLLFVPAGEETRVAPAAWQKSAIIVVGESEAFTAQGGTITFTQEADKIRFAINLEAAERVGLRISSQLLKLASSVRRKT